MRADYQEVLASPTEAYAEDEIAWPRGWNRVTELTVLR
jgi:hypothetical protein